MPQHLAIFLRRRSPNIRLEDVVEGVADPVVKSRLQSMIAADGARSLRRQINGLKISAMLRDHVVALLDRNKLDGLFYPTMVTPAARRDNRETIRIAGREYRVGPALLRNTLLASLAGLPSVSLPIGVSKSGVPVGALLEGRPGQDFSMLQVAAELQSMLRCGYGEKRHG